jgi:SAM-dependent methyltransferase
MTTRYNDKFYATRDEESRYSAQVIGRIVREYINPSSVVDVGCGVGTWLKVIAESGVEDIVGIEGEWVKDDAMVIPSGKVLRKDITSEFSINRQFDLAISLEVAEHISSDRSNQYLDNLTALAPVILFSAAIPLQGGAHHVNEQWPTYWQEKFIARNFLLFDCIRPRIWNDAAIGVWYAQNSFLYVRRDKTDLFPALRPYSTSNPMIDIVHPRFYQFKLATWPVMRALRNRIRRFIKK